MPRQRRTDEIAPRAPRGPRRTDRRTLQTRPSILDAAARLFASSGYEGTAVAAIAAAVGITDAGVLHHFPTKRGLFVAVVDVFVQAQREAIARLLEPGGLPAIENLARWGAVLELAPEVITLHLVASAESVAPASDVRPLLADLHTSTAASVAGCVRSAQRTGEVYAGVDAATAARTITTQMFGAPVHWHLSGRTSSLADDFDRFIGSVLRELRVERARGRAPA